MSIYNSSDLRLGPSSSKTARDAISNPWAGSFTPIASSWLGETVGLTGSSDEAWYLVSDPAVLAFAGIAYLNGLQTPQIEQVDLPGDKLGISYRSVFDYGVVLLEEKAAVKSKGEA
jgi:hypothetical protein